MIKQDLLSSSQDYLGEKTKTTRELPNFADTPSQLNPSRPIDIRLFATTQKSKRADCNAWLRDEARSFPTQGKIPVVKPKLVPTEHPQYRVEEELPICANLCASIGTQG